MFMFNNLIVYGFQVLTIVWACKRYTECRVNPVNRVIGITELLNSSTAGGKFGKYHLQSSGCVKVVPLSL